MTIKRQLLKIKENWLLTLLFVILVAFPMLSSNVSQSLSYAMDKAMSFEAASYRGAGMPYYDEGFAPEVTDRVITKTASLSTEVKTGKFFESENQLKSIIDSSKSYLINENVNKQEVGWKSYYSGNYQIKVATDKYLSVVSQLKEIGEVTSFNENSQDVTGRYTSLTTQLSAEQERLARYETMYAEAKDFSEKLTLSDRIFDQQRTVKALQDAVSKIDQRVDYSTIYVYINEKQSDYANIALVKFSTLIRNLVNSFNELLTLLFWAIPYAIIILIGYVVYTRKVK